MKGPISGAARLMAPIARARQTIKRARAKMNPNRVEKIGIAMALAGTASVILGVAFLPLAQAGLFTLITGSAVMADADRVSERLMGPRALDNYYRNHGI